MFNHSLKRWHSSVGLTILSVCVRSCCNNNEGSILYRDGIAHGSLAPSARCPVPRAPCPVPRAQCSVPATSCAGTHIGDSHREIAVDSYSTSFFKFYQFLYLGNLYISCALQNNSLQFRYKLDLVITF